MIHQFRTMDAGRDNSQFLGQLSHVLEQLVARKFTRPDRLRPAQKTRPVLRAGAGLLSTSEKVPPGETRYNYTLFAGAGVEIDVSPGRAIQIDYRLHHISNADTGRENPGINAHTFMLGLAWGF